MYKFLLMFISDLLLVNYLFLNLLVLFFVNFDQIQLCE